MTVHHPRSDWRCWVVFRFCDVSRVWSLVFGLILIISCADAADRTLKVLVVTGGHGFETNQFFRVFSDNPEITFTNAIQSRTSSTATGTPIDPRKSTLCRRDRSTS